MSGCFPTAGAWTERLDDAYLVNLRKQTRLGIVDLVDALRNSLVKELQRLQLPQVLLQSIDCLSLLSPPKVVVEQFLLPRS